MLNLFHSIHHYCHYCYAPGSSSHHCCLSVHSSLTRTEIHQSLLDSNPVNRFVTAKSFLKFCQGKKLGHCVKKISSNYSFITEKMAFLNVFYEIPQKMTLSAASIASFVTSWLYDFNWFIQRVLNCLVLSDLLDTHSYLEEFQIIWSYFLHEATKLAK